MTFYCGSNGETSVCRTRLFESAKGAFLSVLILLAFIFALVPIAAAQTAGSGSFTVQGTIQWFCPNGSPAKGQVVPNSPCTPITYDAGTVTIIVNGWSTNTSYSQSCTSLCVAQGLASALNASGSPVTAAYSNGVVTITAKATGSQSNYAVTSSAQSTDPIDFPSASFHVSPASFSLTGGTDIPPAAPSGLSATPGASGLSVALSWIDNANNENNYRVERCTGSGCSTFSVLTSTLPPNTASYTDSTTSPSTTYRYRVQATNTAGGSAYATTSDVTTPSVPAAPSNFNATASADGRSVTVTWTDNATNETNYSGNYCPGGTPAGCTTWQNVGTYPANTTTYTKTGLSPGSTNMFEVHAYNAVGDSTHVGNVNVTQPDYPSVPSITSAISGVDGTTAVITWGDVATETAYYLERCTGTGCNSGFTVIGNNLPANTTSFGDSGLTSGTTYGYRVRSYNAVGYSGYSTIAYLTPTTQPPAAPTGLSATSAGNGLSVTLNWTDNASNETSYQLQRCTGTGCTPANYQSLPVNTVSQTDSPTTSSTLYGYAVCAVNAGGSSCSSTTYVTTSSGIATVHYYISDHLGSTSLVVNSNGTVEEEEMYYPYGGERWASGFDSNHYKFTGKERDSETGLDYFGARYYGSNMGRWMSPDWSAGPTGVPYADTNDPQSFNLYGFVRNNPLNRADPNGHWCIFGWVGTTCLPNPPPAPPPPTTPPVITPGTPQNDLANAQDAARADPKFKPVGKPGKPGRKTFCNIATCQIVKNTGTTTDGLIGKNGQPNLANTDVNTLANSPSWRPVSPQEAQDLANQGVTVVGVMYENGHGHIVTVSPELLPGTLDAAKYGPLVNNIGADRSITYGNKAFRGGTPQYYAPVHNK